MSGPHTCAVPLDLNEIDAIRRGLRLDETSPESVLGVLRQKLERAGQVIEHRNEADRLEALPFR